MSSGTVCAEYILYAMRIVDSVKLRVKKPMKLTLDNKGAVDLAQNWSSGGRTRHADIKEHFLRELNKLKLIETQWTPGNGNRADMLSKNVTQDQFKKFAPV